MTTDSNGPWEVSFKSYNISSYLFSHSGGQRHAFSTVLRLLPLPQLMLFSKNRKVMRSTGHSIYPPPRVQTAPSLLLLRMHSPCSQHAGSTLEMYLKSKSIGPPPSLSPLVYATSISDQEFCSIFLFQPWLLIPRCLRVNSSHSGGGDPDKLHSVMTDLREGRFTINRTEILDINSIE